MSMMKTFGKHSAKSIYEHSFNIEFKGYSMLEVDQFLDEVISDYNFFETQLQKASEIIQDLQQKNASLKASLIEAQGRLDVNQTGELSVQQTDLMKRLAKLESEVYKK